MQTQTPFLSLPQVPSSIALPSRNSLGQLPQHPSQPWHLHCHCLGLSPAPATSAASKANLNLCLEILPPLSRSYFWKQIPGNQEDVCLHCHQVHLLATTSPSTWKWTLLSLLRICTSGNFNSKYSAANPYGKRQGYSLSCLKLSYPTSGHQALQISPKDSQRKISPLSRS